MPSVLLISPTDLRAELGRTVLWRKEVRRQFASDVRAALDIARLSPPKLIVMDGAVGAAADGIRQLRADETTRRIAIAALTRNGTAGADALRVAGANVVLPPGADPLLWDAPLDDLLHIPRRRDARIPVRLETWTRVEGGEVIQGRALNISLNGLLFESDHSLDVGTKLDLRFRLPGCDRDLEAVGEVVRQDARPRSGIRFVVLAGSARDAIRAFVEAGVAPPWPDDAEASEDAVTAERRQWESALRASEALKAAILESAPDCVLIMNPEGRVIEVNDAVERLLGYERRAVVGRTVAEILAPQHGAQALDVPDEMAAGGGSLLGRRVGLVVRRSDGSPVPVELTLVRTLVKGRALFTAYLRDTSEAWRAQRLQAALYRVTDASEAIPDAQGLYAAIHQLISEFLDTRSLYIALLGETGRALTFPYVVEDGEARPVPTPRARALAERVMQTGEALLDPARPPSRAGETSGEAAPDAAAVDCLAVPLKTHASPLGVMVVESRDATVRFTDADKELLTFVSHQIASVLLRKRAETRIEQLAYRDDLTGLPNRRLLVDRLDQAIAQAQRDGGMVAVCAVDLDGFKGFNDSLGYGAGDTILRTIAARLKAQIRKGDSVARIGSDEFIAVVRGVRQPADAAKVAEALQGAVREPLRVGEHELFLTGSVGISIFPNDGGDVDGLLGAAHIAMHRAKEVGRDTFSLFQTSMNAEAIQRLRLESDVRRALSRGQLTVHYQPIVNLSSRRIHGVEALLRWIHPERGQVSPSLFIPIAERIGVLSSIGAWVLVTACRQAAAWEARDHPLSVAVNVSARQLQQADFVAGVLRALADSGLAASRLELEITESTAMLSPETTARTLQAVRELGVRISMDDFGTGYSSLTQLQRLRVDTLKIDRSFVRDMTTDPADAAIVSAVTTLARSLELSVVAEGVETVEQLALLEKLGCHRIQGYLVSRPRSAEECAAFLGDDGLWRRPQGPVTAAG